MDNEKLTKKMVADAIEQGVIRVGVYDDGDIVEPVAEDADRNLAFSFNMDTFDLERPVKDGMYGIENDVFARLCKEDDPLASAASRRIPTSILRHPFRALDDFLLVGSPTASFLKRKTSVQRLLSKQACGLTGISDGPFAPAGVMRGQGSLDRYSMCFDIFPASEFHLLGAKQKAEIGKAMEFSPEIAEYVLDNYAKDVLCDAAGYTIHEVLSPVIRGIVCRICSHASSGELEDYATVLANYDIYMFEAKTALFADSYANLCHAVRSVLNARIENRHPKYAKAVCAVMKEDLSVVRRLLSRNQTTRKKALKKAVVKAKHIEKREKETV